MTRPAPWPEKSGTVVNKLFLIILLLALTTSCINQKDYSVPITDPASISRTMGETIAHLARGEVGVAAAILDKLISASPKNKAMLDLKRQIEMARDEYFKRAGWNTACDYTVKGNDSLSGIAGVHLGDVNKFYSLAKLNGIRVPRNLRQGRHILVPADDCPLNPQNNDYADVKPSSNGEVTARKAVAVDEYLQRASDQERSGNLQVALDVMNEAEQDYPNDQTVVSFKESLLAQFQALAHLTEGDAFQADKHNVSAMDSYRRARSLFEEATVHSRASAHIQERLDILRVQISKLEVTLRQQADDHYSQAQDYKSMDDVTDIESLEDLADLEQSHLHYKRAAELDPGNQIYTDALIEINGQLAAHYHRFAMKKYSAKTLPALEEAIEIWDALLRRSPNYQQAVKKREKAVKLREVIKRKSGG